jgi:hypothetical protein
LNFTLKTKKWYLNRIGVIKVIIVVLLMGDGACLHSDRDDPRRRGNLILQEDLFEYVKD